jgi:hypothetical protein
MDFRSGCDFKYFESEITFNHVLSNLRSQTWVTLVQCLGADSELVGLGLLGEVGICQRDGFGSNRGDHLDLLSKVL